MSRGLNARGDCPEPVHDWPLPFGMCWGSDDSTAFARIRHGWRQKRCPVCRRYGWVPGVLDIPNHGIQQRIEP